MHRKTVLIAIAAGLVGGAFFTTAARGKEGHDSLNFRIFGDSPLTSIRGVAAAGNPWVTDNSRVRLDAAGRLDIKIRGLVIAAGVNQAGGLVPAAVVGSNPVATVRVAVTWMAPGGPVFLQETGPLPLDAHGDLNTQVQLNTTPPAGAERPIILIRAGSVPGAGPFIASSGYVSDLGSSNPNQGED